MVQTQEHLSPVNPHISQTVEDALQHLDPGITTFGKASGGKISFLILFSAQGFGPPYPFFSDKIQYRADKHLHFGKKPVIIKSLYSQVRLVKWVEYPLFC